MPSSAKVPSALSTSTRTSPLASTTDPSASLTSTGCASGAASKAAHPYPGTSRMRATILLVDGCSMATRTMTSGFAPSLV